MTNWVTYTDTYINILSFFLPIVSNLYIPEMDLKPQLVVSNIGYT